MAEIGFLVGEYGQEIAERGQDREAYAPAVAVLCAEERNLAKHVGLRNAGRELSLHRFGNDETDVMRKAVPQPPTPVRDRSGMSERDLHSDITIAHFDRAARRVVCP